MNVQFGSQVYGSRYSMLIVEITGVFAQVTRTSHRKGLGFWFVITINFEYGL